MQNCWRMVGKKSLLTGRGARCLPFLTGHQSGLQSIIRERCGKSHDALCLILVELPTHNLDIFSISATHEKILFREFDHSSSHSNHVETKTFLRRGESSRICNFWEYWLKCIVVRGLTTRKLAGEHYGSVHSSGHQPLETLFIHTLFSYFHLPHTFTLFIRSWVRWFLTFVENCQTEVKFFRQLR